MRPTEVRELLQFEPLRWRRADRTLSRAADIADLRRAAHRYWPRGVRDYVEGGADGEVSLERNRAAFTGYELVPRVLRDIREVTTATDLLGVRSELPFALAPTGYTRMMHADGETAVARAAAGAGIPYTLTTMSTTAIENIPRGGPQWFQLYMWRDRALVRDLLARAAAHGCSSLMLTVDTAVTGHRLRDTRNGFTLPPRLTPRTVMGMTIRPSWSLSMLRGAPVTFANVPPRMLQGSETVMDFAARQFDLTVDWSDLDWLRCQWGGRLAVKGVVAVDDAAKAVEHGADAVVVSNHGGRQLDQTITPLCVLPEIRDRIPDTQVLLDSGIRRGTDIAIALALGADGVLVGRPYLYGLGAAGQAGVSRAIDILATELRKAVQLLGVRSVDELRKGGPALVRQVRE